MQHHDVVSDAMRLGMLCVPRRCKRHRLAIASIPFRWFVRGAILNLRCIHPATTATVRTKADVRAPTVDAPLRRVCGRLAHEVVKLEQFGIPPTAWREGRKQATWQHKFRNHVWRQRHRFLLNVDARLRTTRNAFAFQASQCSQQR